MENNIIFDNVEYNLNSICRVCMSDANSLKEIYSETTLAQLRLFVEVFEGDLLPQQICEMCVNQLAVAYDFKIKSEQSDRTLRMYIMRKNSSEIKEEDDHLDFPIPITIKPEIMLEEEDGPIIDPLNEQFGGHDSTKSEDFEDDDDKNDIGDGDDSDDDEDNDPSFECDDDDDVEEDYDQGNSDSNAGDSNIEHIVEPSNIDYKAAKNEHGRYNCQFCEKTLVDAKGLKLHTRLHTGLNLKRCTICQKGFTKSNHLMRHMDTHKAKSYKCKKCDEIFNSAIELKSHSDAVHNEKDSKTLSLAQMYEAELINPLHNLFVLCKICDTTFTKIKDLRFHIFTHLHAATFQEIKLHDKLFLFDLMKINPATENHENLVKCITDDIQSNTIHRFYHIRDPCGYELQLSDSESETEEVPGDEIKPPQGTYECPKCGLFLNRSYKLYQHIRDTHPGNKELPHTCSTCSRKFATEFLLRRHHTRQCQNSIKQHACTACSIKFMWQDSLLHHNDKFHSGKQRAAKKKESEAKSEKAPTPKEKNFVCETCNKAFYRHEHLDRHVKIHLPSEKKFGCSICDKKFNRKDNLRSHMRVHREVKEETDKHLCVYCGRSFSNSSNLIVHMRRHTGEKPYKCDLCDKGFPRSSDLQCHRRTHTGEKPCLCTICGKGFSRSNKLVRHMRIHTGIRPYKCTHCDRAFTQSNDLTLHIRRHTGEKPYVCGVCGDRFIQGTALQTHRRMQGHYEEVNPNAPFANISVNNPNRFTNANRVNRIGLPSSLSPQPTRDETATSGGEMEATVAIRRKSTKSISTRRPSISETQSSASSILAHAGAPPVIEELNSPMRSEESSMETSHIHRNIPNIHPMPPGASAAYIPNGVPYLSNTGVLMQNLEVSNPTLYSLATYNPNYH